LTLRSNVKNANKEMKHWNGVIAYKEYVIAELLKGGSADLIADFNRDTKGDNARFIN